MNKTAITGVRIIDGINSSIIEKGTILINDGKIEAVSPMEKMPIPETYNIIKMENHTVLPALIDGHVHVTGEPGRLDHIGHIKANLVAVRKLQNYLAWGVGTVANAASSADSIPLRELVKNGTLQGCADILLSGTVTATGGHVRGRSADGPWEVRKAVREMVMAGLDHIKTCASGGFQWEHEKLEYEDYTPIELQALVEEAHARGKRVHVHAHAQPGLRNAVNAGADLILHGAHIDDEALEAIGEKGLWYMPTLYITSELVWKENKNLPQFMARKMERAWPLHREGVAKAYKMGLKIVAGTDGFGPDAMMIEMNEMVRCGISPMDAIMIATGKTADALGILHETGTLEAGKKADILCIKGNPLDDMGILKKFESIAMVMKAGKIIPGSAI
ncbi:MAG: hypothetical protein A2017_06185 [Lentisphaerae bacterium GWF2_44_16]|nr:MAG: hypothetical protein A2017_06185 [Lentisphaerae bacterium GWF2_44_16]